MFLTLISQAPPVPAPVPGTGENSLNIAGQVAAISPITTIGRLIEIGADAILFVGTLAVILYLLMGAFKWITAGGEKGKIEEARNMITQAIVGIVILASVFAIYRLVLRFIGLDTRINLNSSDKVVEPGNPPPGNQLPSDALGPALPGGRGGGTL